MKIYLLIFHLILINLNGSTVTADDEPEDYKFILDAVTAEKEDDDVAKIKVELDKSGDLVKISGQAELFFDLDNTWQLKIVLKGAGDSNDEYKDLIALPLLGVCDFMNFYYKIYLYDSLVKYSNAPSPADCPVVSDTYILSEYPLILGNFQKFLHPGFYSVEAILFHEDEEKFKYRIEGHVIEER
ncbi:PREDICTED: uncharacterized protein LOC108362276 [Rhagoletis zephyria]|uniref:uncharacterized protein LOC108362276 n=1 Tax=Rhagoletis zephyria TaxID=28612 RepID=UPI0008117884|nr:PREDICTED: uncharacterized protein LOC108362276 [Rhagoletis zephyria]